MPIYEYECATCGHRFEKLVRLGAETPPCASCASAEVQKRISASGFILKGGGWYKDHYGLKSDKSASASGGSEKSSGDSTASTDAGGSSPASKAEGVAKPKSEAAIVSKPTPTATASK